MLLIAIAIKLDSRGPVFFRQKRYGFVNKTFYIFKFRTMEHATKSAGKTLQATRDDPRVTRRRTITCGAGASMKSRRSLTF